MTLKMSVVSAVILTGTAAFLSWILGSESAQIEKTSPLGLRMISVPSSIHGEKITSAALSGNGLLALGTAGGRIAIVDKDFRPWRGGTEVSAGPSHISALTFSQDGAALAGVTNGAPFIWRTGDPKVTNIPVKADDWEDMALSSGGRLLAIAAFNVSVFDVMGRRLVREFEQETQAGGNGAYSALAFTPDAVSVVAASEESTDTWNIESGKRVAHWSCRCALDGVAISRDAALAIVGTANAHVLLWDVITSKFLKDKTVSQLTGDHVYGTAANLKGTLVAAGTAAGSVVVWDTRSDAIVARTQVSPRPIVRVESSDDGKLLLVYGPKEPYVRGMYDLWLITLSSS
jgi:WD40 repeat protein